MRILVINGPNLNLLGIREPHIYGKETYDNLISYLNKLAVENGIQLSVFQSNHEGAIIDIIQEALDEVDGIVINAGAYSHTSIAIYDALKAVALPAVEVHISDVNKREEFRKNSYVAQACVKTFIGDGFYCYKRAILFLKEHYSKQ